MDKGWVKSMNMLIQMVLLCECRKKYSAWLVSDEEDEMPININQ